MKEIHPNPIVEQMRTFSFVIILTLLLSLLFGLVPAFVILAVLAVWGLGFLHIVFLFIWARFVSLEVGKKDLLFKRGILNIRTSIVPYKKITDARFRQTMWERLFSVGTLEIDTAGSDRTAIYMPSVPFKDIEMVISTVRKKRGDEEHE